MKIDKFLDKYYKNLKDHNDEHFKYITYPNIKGKYVISNYGKVINFMTNKVKKCTTFDKDGYLRIDLPSLTHSNGRMRVGIHRLVAWEYCNKPEGCDIVNHIDANVRNNYYKNLEWTTVKGNTQHAIRMGLTVRAGCNTASSKYSQEIIDTIIEKLKNGENVHQVYSYFYPNCSIADHFEFYALISKILHKSSHEIDSRGIEFPKEAFESTLRKKWTKNETDELVDMIKKGMTNLEIMRYYGFKDTRSDGACRYRDKLHELRKQLGIESYNPYTEINNQIKSMVAKGYTNKEILKYFGFEKYRDKGASTIAHNATKFRRELNPYNNL